jgi:hypothetical protein
MGEIYHAAYIKSADGWEILRECTNTLLKFLTICRYQEMIIGRGSAFDNIAMN